MTLATRSLHSTARRGSDARACSEQASSPTADRAGQIGIIMFVEVSVEACCLQGRRNVTPAANMQRPHVTIEWGRARW